MEKTRNFAILAGCALCLFVTFFAGREFEAQTIPFTHVEVENIAAKCGDGEYIGACVECKSCADYEFANGGCSFFKDTFCSFCEPIANCVRENIVCSNRYDQECSVCECPDPVNAWSDIELMRFTAYNMEIPEGQSLESTTYACYFDVDCKPCSVCPEGTYEASPCTQDEDTYCKKCSECGEDEFVAEICAYQSDTVCQACTHCQEGEFTSSLCTAPLYGIDSSFSVEGDDAVCTECSPCGETEWVSTACTVWTDTECTECSLCQDLEYIDTRCDAGDVLTDGADTICADCTPPQEEFWEFSPCIKTEVDDSVYKECTVCQEGEFEALACGASNDAICPDCTPINHCSADVTICSTDADSLCINCPMDGTGWSTISCCEEGFLGETCGFMRTNSDCGTLTYRERTARRGGFEGETVDEFLAWCMLMCDEFPDCYAFEVVDNGVDGSASGEMELNDGTTCELKDTPTTVGTDYSKDCYSKLSLNSEEDILAAVVANAEAE